MLKIDLASAFIASLATLILILASLYALGISLVKSIYRGIKARNGKSKKKSRHP